MSTWRLHVAALALLVPGCGGGNNESSSAGGSIAEVFSPSSPRPLHLTVEARPIANGARISGQTNLPGGAILHVEMRRGPVGAGAEVTVAGGRFGVELHPERGGRTAPGVYEVEVSTALGAFQPDHVRSQLGSNYEALTGGHLKETDFGRTIDYRAQVTIGGAASPTADRAARKQAYREHVEFSERSCAALPDDVERLSGRRSSPGRRARSIRMCLDDMAESRREMQRQGQIER